MTSREEAIKVAMLDGIPIHKGYVAEVLDRAAAARQIHYADQCPQPQGRVLWQSKTKRPPRSFGASHGDSCVTVYGLPVPPGTEVAVVVLGDSHGETET